MAKAASNTTASNATTQGSQDKKLSKEEILSGIQHDLNELHAALERNFDNSFVQQNIRQSIKAAVTGIDQEIRNMRIDAEMEAKKLQGPING